MNLEYNKNWICGIRRSLYGVIDKVNGRKKSFCKAFCGICVKKEKIKNFLKQVCLLINIRGIMEQNYVSMRIVRVFSNCDDKDIDFSYMMDLI